MKDHKSRPHRGKIVGSHVLLEQLGQGTFGVVWRAVDKVTGEERAVKVIPRLDIDEVTVNREVRLLTLLARLQHKNVIQLHDAKQSATNLYVTMEYVQGEELRSVIVRQKYLKAPLCLDYFTQLLVGLHVCHTSQICHRDLKPENILINTQGVLKIADFGVSALQDSAQYLNTTCGSPHYSAPEVLSERAYDGFLADIWSCGVILFAMASGRLPFQNEDVAVLHRSIMAGIFVVPPIVDPQIEYVIRQLLVVNPANRPVISDIACYPWFNDKGLQNELKFVEDAVMFSKECDESQVPVFPFLNRTSSDLLDQDKSQSPGTSPPMQPLKAPINPTTPPLQPTKAPKSHATSPEMQPLKTPTNHTTSPQTRPLEAPKDSTTSPPIRPLKAPTKAASHTHPPSTKPSISRILAQFEQKDNDFEVFNEINVIDEQPNLSRISDLSRWMLDPLGLHPQDQSMPCTDQECTNFVLEDILAKHPQSRLAAGPLNDGISRHLDLTGKDHLDILGKDLAPQALISHPPSGDPPSGGLSRTSMGSSHSQNNASPGNSDTMQLQSPSSPGSYQPLPPPRPGSSQPSHRSLPIPEALSRSTSMASAEDLTRSFSPSTNQPHPRSSPTPSLPDSDDDICGPDIESPKPPSGSSTGLRPLVHPMSTVDKISAQSPASSGEQMYNLSPHTPAPPVTHASPSMPQKARPQSGSPSASLKHHPSSPPLPPQTSLSTGRPSSNSIKHQSSSYCPPPSTPSSSSVGFTAMPPSGTHYLERGRTSARAPRNLDMSTSHNEASGSNGSFFSLAHPHPGDSPSGSGSMAARSRIPWLIHTKRGSSLGPHANDGMMSEKELMPPIRRLRATSSQVTMRATPASLIHNKHLSEGTLPLGIFTPKYESWLLPKKGRRRRPAKS